MDIAGEILSPIEYGGMSGSPKRQAFEALDAVARAYPGAQVQYLRQN